MAEIFWAGAEDIDFESGATPDTTAGYFRPGFGRFGIKAPASGLRSPMFGPRTALWLSFRVYPNTSSAQYLVGLGGEENTNRLYIYGTSNDLQIRKYIVTTGTQIGPTASGKFQYGGLHKVDVEITGYPNGTINVYIDYILATSFTGDLTLTGISQFTRVVSGTSATPTYSEFMVADVDTRGLSCVTGDIVAPGDLQEWNGAYSQINENAQNDSTVVNTNFLDKFAQYNLRDLPEGTFSPIAVKLAARMFRSVDSLPTRCHLGVKANGAVDDGAGIVLATVPTNYERIIGTTNPITGQPWTQNDITTLQLSLKSAA